MDPHNHSAKDASDPHNNTSNASINSQQSNGNRIQPLIHKPDDKTRPSGQEAAKDDSNTSTSEPTQIPVPPANPSDAAEMDFIRELIEELGPDRFAVFVYLGILGIILASVVGLCLLSWSWITAIICVFLGFVAVSLPSFCISDRDCGCFVIFYVSLWLSFVVIHVRVVVMKSPSRYASLAWRDVLNRARDGMYCQTAAQAQARFDNALGRLHPVAPSDRS